MSRATRLMDLLERLRGGEATTVDALASTMGVSARTMRRDLATLREQGLPVLGEAGPGGGIRLDSHRGLTAVHLSLSEIVTLWLTANLSTASTALPWSTSAASALAKLLTSLPRERARALRALCRRVIVGSPASGPVSASARAAPRELVALFEQAFSGQVGLAFDYTDRQGGVSWRRVEPHGLLVQMPVWYVLARDADRGTPRMFRMDRISRPSLLKELTFRPDPQVIWALLPEGFGWHPLLGKRPP